ncbi:MAG: CAP domain-containing protein [Chloroflexota bacterium]|nr:CAP domain-containing protein [Chloroflexota bacterium]
MTSATILRRVRPRAFVLPLLLLAAFALFSACTPEVNAEMKTYSGINAIRVQAGLLPLTPDANLVNVARVRSADMAAKSYFSHYPPDGCNYACLLDKFGVPRTYAGENIAWNTWDWTKTADVAVEMWHNSPPHMQNILDCHYERFGTGVVKAPDGKVYYTMIFEGNGRC